MAKTKVRVRTYRHGLGDCHLLSFTKSSKQGLFHILIDCGVVDVTPNHVAVMNQVVQDVAKEIRNADRKSVLDLVIATHQHTDHLSGFLQAQAAFDKIEMKRLWLAWTEDKVKGKKVKQQLGRALAAARQALASLKDAKSEAAQRIEGVLDFFGALPADGEKTQAALDYLKGRKGIDIKFHEPGTVFNLPEVPNVRVYVLGPPEDVSYLEVTNPRKTKHEGYEETSLAADAEGFINALLPIADGGDAERSFPFSKMYRKSEMDASAMPFFQSYYGFNGQGEVWRKIDFNWLDAGEKLALALNNLTNNTSLALAFEFIDSGEILLFPGDAQIGSWLSWRNLVWKVEGENGNLKEVRIDDLLARTVFYKASHHASHNGTLGLLGLEKMSHRDLVVFVPVDKAMSKRKHWDRTLPWQPLLIRLNEQSRGRMVLTDVNEKPPVAATLENLTPAERLRFSKQVDITERWADYLL